GGGESRPPGWRRASDARYAAGCPFSRASSASAEVTWGRSAHRPGPACEAGRTSTDRGPRRPTIPGLPSTPRHLFEDAAMEYELACGCGNVLRVSEDTAGSSIACPCGQTVAMPSPGQPPPQPHPDTVETPGEPRRPRPDAEVLAPTPVTLR